MALSKKKLMQPTWTAGKNVGVPNLRPVAPAAPAAPAYKPPPFAGDSTLFGNIAQARFARDTEITQMNADNVYDTAQHQDYVGKLARNQMDTDSGYSANAAKQGLSYSGHLAKQVADNALRTNDLKATSSAQLAKQISDRGMRYQALSRQYGDPGNPNDWGLYGVTEMDASRGRYLASDPAGDVKAPVKSPASGDASYPFKNSKTGEIYRESREGGKLYHVYKGGRKVKVNG